MKAILVIDMPKSCNKCKLKTHRFGFTTNKMKVGCKFKGDILTDVLSDRPNWCPLKPLPQRKIVGEIEKVDDFMKSDIQIINEKVTTQIMLDTELLLASGYNLCLDEILGE